MDLRFSFFFLLSNLVIHLLKNLLIHQSDHQIFNSFVLLMLLLLFIPPLIHFNSK